MRNLEDIEKDLSAAREALSVVEGTPAEVYSRIVGYYRSVRNWNRGKREEYGERRLYDISNCVMRPASQSLSVDAEEKSVRSIQSGIAEKEEAAEEMRLLLFMRHSCPGCPPAKAAAGKLGIPVDFVNADTSEGMAEAVKRNVMSTPTAILIAPGGNELGRANDAAAIGRLLVPAEAIAV